MSAFAGTLEVMTAIILGKVIDTALAAGPDGFFSEHVLFLAGTLAFFLILRPIAFGVSSAANSIVVGPNVMPLVLTRLHRWTLGQAVTFFDNDFAGRIIAKTNADSAGAYRRCGRNDQRGFFRPGIADRFGVASYNDRQRIALALAIWLVVYFALIRWFMPRIRFHAKARASARAMVTGQVVDTITNIKTVKLFAHAGHEESAAIDAVASFRERLLIWALSPRRSDSP